MSDWLPWNFYAIFLDPEVIFSLRTIFINPSTKEFTLVNNAIPSYDIALEHYILQYRCQCLLKYWRIDYTNNWLKLSSQHCLVCLGPIALANLSSFCGFNFLGQPRSSFCYMQSRILSKFLEANQYLVLLFVLF